MTFGTFAMSYFPLLIMLTFTLIPNICSVQQENNNKKADVKPFSIILLLTEPIDTTKKGDDNSDENDLNYKIENSIQLCGQQSMPLAASAATNSSECEKRLRSCLLFLINWAHDEKDVLTGIVSFQRDSGTRKYSGESTVLSGNHLNYNYYNFGDNKLEDVASNSQLMDIVPSDKKKPEMLTPIKEISGGKVLMSTRSNDSCEIIIPNLQPDKINITSNDENTDANTTKKPANDDEGNVVDTTTTKTLNDDNENLNTNATKNNKGSNKSAEDDECSDNDPEDKDDYDEETTIKTTTTKINNENDDNGKEVYQNRISPQKDENGESCVDEASLQNPKEDTKPKNDDENKDEDEAEKSTKSSSKSQEDSNEDGTTTNTEKSKSNTIATDECGDYVDTKPNKSKNKKNVGRQVDRYADDELPILSEPIASGNIPIQYAYPRPIKFNNINKYQHQVFKKETSGNKFKTNIKLFKRFLRTDFENTNYQKRALPLLNIYNILRSLKQKFKHVERSIKIEGRRSSVHRSTNTNPNLNVSANYAFDGPSLMDILKPTLTVIKNESKPFLLVILGGEFSEVKDEKTNTGRALTYLQQNVNKTRRTIIVTQQCPKGDTHDAYLPLYAKGYLSSVFNDVQNLCQIPIMIKKIIECNLDPSFTPPKH